MTELDRLINVGGEVEVVKFKFFLINSFVCFKENNKFE